MKLKAVFLADDRDEKIEQVFNAKIRGTMKTMVDLHPVYIHPGNAEERLEELRDVRIAFATWGIPPFSTEMLHRYMPNLNVLFYAAGSVQRFARDFMEANVTVVSAWGANSVPVAEFTAAQILLANKGFLSSSRLYKKGDFRGAKQVAGQYPGNYGARVGILGAGMIGRKVIELLGRHELAVDVFDPFLPDETAARMGVRKTDLIDIFTNCDTISNHLANLPATQGMLHKDHFNRMKPYATFINTGRGAQVVEADLIRALKEVPTRTALLDVTYPEPVAADSELLLLDNVILTPHIAGSMNLEVARMGSFMVEECERYLNGEALKYQVTPEMLATMA